MSQPRDGEPLAAISIEVGDTQPHLRVDAERMAALARRVLAAEGIRRASISIAVVDDATIHAVNRQHLDHDEPTDVISFSFSEPGEPELCGELVVSAETASAQAKALGCDPADELALYVVHGLLHLCGYDDQTAHDAAVMRQRETEHLAGEAQERADQPSSREVALPTAGEGR